MTFSNIPNGRAAKGYAGYLTWGGSVQNPNVVNQKYNYNSNSEKVLCALDINWCKANLSSSSNISGMTYITTTEELLTLIDAMNTRLYNLTAAVIALSNK